MGFVCEMKAHTHTRSHPGSAGKETSTVQISVFTAGFTSFLSSGVTTSEGMREETKNSH